MNLMSLFPLDVKVLWSFQIAIILAEVAAILEERNEVIPLEQDGQDFTQILMIPVEPEIMNTIIIIMETQVVKD